MIGLNNIIELLKLVVFSGYVKGENPVSVLITAEPEAGKTEMVMKFSRNKGILTLTDCTAYGIMSEYEKDITSGTIKHLLIPDLVKPMSRQRDTVNSLIAFFNSLIEEGVYRINTYAEKIVASSHDRDGNIIPVKCGLIATLARNILSDGRHHWTDMGFMSRMLPISYSYHAKTRMSIHNSIAAQEYHNNQAIVLDLPAENQVVSLPKLEGDKLIAVTSTVNSLDDGRKNAFKTYGFRLQKQLQCLAMSNAIMEGRETVNSNDIDKVASLSNFINLNYLPI